MLTLMELCVRTRNRGPSCVISTIGASRPAHQRRRRLLIGKLDEDNSSESTPIYSVSSQSVECSQRTCPSDNLDLSSERATQSIITDTARNTSSLAIVAATTTTSAHNVAQCRPQRAETQQAPSASTSAAVDIIRAPRELQSPIESLAEGIVDVDVDVDDEARDRDRDRDEDQHEQHDDHDHDDDDGVAVSSGTCNGSSSRSGHESYSSINSQRAQYQRHKWQGNTLI